MRRSEPEFDIPEFLSGRPSTGNDVSGGFKGDWTEVHRLPRRPKD
ncbi:hypothetical protein [Thauera aminoaromatica]|nr:hypothetical protein [Thauera aminoaromatica]